jgi:hypothetical protein
MTDDDTVFDFLVLEEAAAEVTVPTGTGDFGTGGEDLERHVKLPGVRAARKVGITAAELETFWREKVIGLADTLTTAQAQQEPKGFRVEEIAFSIGVGAKGGLLFVAEASAQASITVKLARKT